MDIPEKIKVGPLVYEVRILDDLRKEDGSSLEGRIEYSEQVIKLRKQSPGRMYVTLWHELLHAIDDLADTQIGEDAITRLAPILTAVLIDNAPLV